MSSFFNPRTIKRKPPLWCKTAIHAKVSGLLSPMPTDLIAYCEWIEEDLVPPANVGESFCCHGDGTGNHYSGSGQTGHYKLKLSLDRIGDSYYWEILLKLISEDGLLDQESWHDFFIFGVGLFNTGYNFVQYPGCEGYLTMEASG